MYNNFLEFNFPYSWDKPYVISVQRLNSTGRCPAPLLSVPEFMLPLASPGLIEHSPLCRPSILHSPKGLWENEIGIGKINIPINWTSYRWRNRGPEKLDDLPVIAGGGAGTGTALLASVECSCLLSSSSHPPAYTVALTPQCEEVKETVQRHTQSMRHSKEELNRLNQAIQKLTVDVDPDKSQVRGGNQGWKSGEIGVCPLSMTTRLGTPPVPLEKMDRVSL